MWNDADNLQKCCRVLEREFGFKVDNGSWQMNEYGDVYRARRDMPARPRGAARCEIFSDRESLHSYAVRETRERFEKYRNEGKLDWPMLHKVLYTSGLGVREQNGGLAVYDLKQPDGFTVKASDVHPAISLPAMTSRCGEFQEEPPNVYNPARPQDGVYGIFSEYQPNLHVRDQELRQERREARAVAREILRQRYETYREGWEKPDLRAAERFRQIISHCQVMKSHVYRTVRDPQMRKLMYRVAEFEKMKSMAELRLQLREERQFLKDAGANRPHSWKSWVEREALRGDVAAISQMRGWAYREKRRARKENSVWPEPNVVIRYGPGEDITSFRSSGHETRLLRDGTISYLQDGKPAVTDFGDRVEVYAAPNHELDRHNNDLAAELTAWHHGENVEMTGEAKAINRVLYSGVIRNIYKNDGRRFEVGDPEHMVKVRATEESLRRRDEPNEQRRAEPDARNDENVHPFNRNTPRL